MTDFAALRERRVARDVATRGLDGPALLAALRAVLRGKDLGAVRFVPLIGAHGFFGADFLQSGSDYSIK